MQTDNRVIIYENMIGRNIVAVFECGCRMKVESLVLKPEVCPCLETHLTYREMPKLALLVQGYEARFSPVRRELEDDIPS